MKKEANGSIKYDPSICSGCGVCVDVCSLYHFGECSPYLSAITLHMNPIDAYTTEVETCHQCLEPVCVTACPTEAMYIHEESGAICIISEECIACGLCAEACEFNKRSEIIKYNPQMGKYFKCDLCEGNPQCVSCCPMGALSFQGVQ